MNYTEAISYLYALQKYGIKFGLDNTIKLLSLFDNPHHRFKTIHVAGTNGKGSTSAMIASMLEAQGFRVGLFTSPHLVSFTERIRINKDEISEKDVIDSTVEIKSMIDKVNHGFSPTFFEFVTVMAFIHFSRKDVDWAVIEAGMGGRLDATNVITPSVSVITRIGLDHQEFLGDTLKKIAFEKAGIIKKNVHVITASQDEEVLQVIINRAAEMGSEISVYSRDFRSIPKSITRNGITFDYYGWKTFKNLYAPLSGKHQLENASLAVRALEVALGLDLKVSSVRHGLADTKWPGRLDLIKRPLEPYDILIDGAHNTSAAIALRNAINSYYKGSYERIVFIIGIMADKDIEGIIKPLLPLSHYTIFTAPDYKRASEPEALLEKALKLGFEGDSIPSIKESLNKAIAKAKTLPGRTLIVITGSFYTIGEAFEELGVKGILTRLRE